MKILSGNINLEVKDFGSKTHTPLIMISGFGSQLIDWPSDLINKLIEKKLRVIIFDNRDVGLSTWFDDAGEPNMNRTYLSSLFGRKIKAPYSLSDMAADALGVLDSLEIDKAHLIGASMGGMIVQRFALNHPERVASLCSIMSTPRFIRPEYQLTVELMEPDSGTREGRIESGLKSARLIHGDKFPLPENLRELVAASIDRAWNPAGTNRQLTAILADGDRRPELETLSIPTTVIHGTADRLVPPRGGKETAKAIKDSRLVEIEGMGHSMPEETWTEIFQVFDELVDKSKP